MTSLGIFLNGKYLTEQGSIGTATSVGLARLCHYQSYGHGPFLIEVETEGGWIVEVNELADSLEKHSAYRFDRSPRLVFGGNDVTSTLG